MNIKMYELSKYEVESAARIVLAHANDTAVDRSTKMTITPVMLGSKLTRFAWTVTTGSRSARSGSWANGDLEWDARGGVVREMDRYYHNVIGDIPLAKDEKSTANGMMNLHIPLDLPTDVRYAVGKFDRCFVGWVEHNGSVARQESATSSSSTYLNYPILEDSFVRLVGKKPGFSAVSDGPKFFAGTCMISSSNQLGTTTTHDAMDTYYIHGYKFRGFECRFSP